MENNNITDTNYKELYHWLNNKYDELTKENERLKEQITDLEDELEAKAIGFSDLENRFNAVNDSLHRTQGQVSAYKFCISVQAGNKPYEM